MDEHDLQSPKLATGSLWELFVRVAGPASSVSVLTSEQGYSPLIVDCGGLFCYNFGTTAVSLIADDTLKCLFSICVRKVGGEGEGRRETGGKSYSSGICVLMSRGSQNPPPPQFGQIRVAVGCPVATSGPRRTSSNRLLTTQLCMYSVKGIPERAVLLWRWTVCVCYEGVCVV